MSNVSSRKTSVLVMLSSLKMSLATLLSRILGLVRDQVIANLFGAGGLTDAFFVANRIPNLLRDLFAEGAFSSAFVPTFTKTRLESERNARELLWSLFLLLGGLTGTIAAFIYYFAPQLVSSFAPSFVQDPSKFHTTVVLVQIMAPFLCLISLAALFMGVLNTLKSFFIPALAPAFYNVTMILSCLILPGWLIAQGHPAIYALGIGVLAGGFVQVLMQLPFLIYRKQGPVIPRKIFSKQALKVFILLGPGLLGFAATQINLLVATVLATGAAVGAVSWLSYGFRLFQFPIGVLSVSISNSNLVHFSEAWKSNQKKRAVEFFGSSYNLSLLTLLPAMALMIALAPETIQIIFERGKFTATDTLMTSRALRFYLLGLPFYGLYKIFVPIFYTLDLARIPVTCSIISIALNIVFCVIFTPLYGFEMLALGMTLSMILNSSMQGLILKKHLSLPISFYLNLRLVKILFSALLCCGTSYFLVQRFFGYQDILIVKILQFVGISFTGLISYLATLYCLGEGKNLRNLRSP